VTCGYRTLAAGCKWLAALTAGFAFGHERGRGRTSAPTGDAMSGLGANAPSTSAAPTHGFMPGTATSAPAAAASSLPMTKGGGFFAPSAVAGSRARAGAWAEALSGAGKQLSDEGFEDQSVMCFVAAGKLDAIAHGDTTDG
jgi:hypothetical protein